jgi:partner of Y14 and mago
MPSATSPNRPSTPISTSGIQTLPTGHSVIPSSVRPDGSTRKEIKVRPGYRPPEDQEKYRNRNVEARSNIGKGGIPGAEPTSTPVKGAEEKNKNAKRREAARKKASATAANTTDGNQIPDPGGLKEIANGLETAHLHSGESETDKLKQAWRDPSKLATNKEADEAAEKEKKARNLKKKLRQARELKEKKEGGGELLPEQLAKVTKIQELIRDLDKLGYDADGELKADVNGLEDGAAKGQD